MNRKNQLVSRLVPKPLQTAVSERTNQLRLLVRPYYREAVWYLHQPQSTFFKAGILLAWLYGICCGFMDLIGKQN